MESLQSRLSTIPATTVQSRSLSILKPCLAFACAVTVALVIGSTVSQKTVPAGNSQEDEIVEYLIDSGTTLAQICYCIDGE